MSAPAAAPASVARLDFLDGLRGLAALGVVLHHFLAAFYPSTITGNPATAHLPGRWEADFATSPLYALLTVRICFFFMLSGLVLAASAARAPRGLRMLLAQLARRYARLGIPVALSVTLGYGLLLAHGFYHQSAAAASGAAWLQRYWHHLPTFRQYVGDSLFGVLLRGEILYNPVLWTMVIEWRGSMLVLGLLALAGGWRGRLPLYAALALGMALGQVSYYYVDFVLGLALYEVHRQGWATRLAAPWRWALGLALLALALATSLHHQGPYQAATGPAGLPGVGDERADDLFHTLEAAAVLGAVLLSARLRRWVGGGLLRGLGKRAFALYLTHFLVLGSGASWLFGALLPRFSYHASAGLTGLAAVPVLVVVAEAFYRGVDVPSHALARWVGRLVAAGLGLPRPAAPASAPPAR